MFVGFVVYYIFVAKHPIDFSVVVFYIHICNIFCVRVFSKRIRLGKFKCVLLFITCILDTNKQ